MPLLVCVVCEKDSMENPDYVVEDWGGGMTCEIFLDRYTLFYKATMYAVKDLTLLEDRCALAKQVSEEKGCICNDGSGVDPSS